MDQGSARTICQIAHCPVLPKFPAYAAEVTEEVPARSAWAEVFQVTKRTKSWPGRTRPIGI